MFDFVYLLQVKLADVWQVPFHFVGSEPNSVSLKLSDSGQIPVSSIPTMILFSITDLFTFLENPIKSHDLDVWSCFF